MKDETATKTYIAKCFKCHASSMEKLQINYDQIEYEKQCAYNDGFNEGYKKAKEEMKKKLGL